MRRPRSPFALAAAILAGWLNRHQQAVIDYLLTENRILREKLGTKRLQFSDAERRRLARKGGPLGRRIIEAIARIVTPETILAWHRKLVAAKWTFKSRERRTKTDDRKELEALIVRFATENPGWGLGKSQGALANLGHDVAPNTIKAIFLRHGIEPSPERRKRRSWKQFLKVHASSIVATDFFTTDVLFAIDHASRTVQILASTARPEHRVHGACRVRARQWDPPQQAIPYRRSRLEVPRRLQGRPREGRHRGRSLPAVCPTATRSPSVGSVASAKRSSTR